MGETDNVIQFRRPTRLDELPMLDPDHAPGRRTELRILEALLFASQEPLDERILQRQMPDPDVPVGPFLLLLQSEYLRSGINLVNVAGKWAFRTAPDMGPHLKPDAPGIRRLSKAAVEMLTIIAYQQPVTRVEIEGVRGCTTLASTMLPLLEAGWIRPRGRRRSPGRPLTFGTTELFLSHFGLASLADLPPLVERDEVSAATMDALLRDDINIPSLLADEEPLDPGDLDLSITHLTED